MQPDKHSWKDGREIETCPQPSNKRCNDDDPDLCCGGGADAPCSCKTCHPCEAKPEAPAPATIDDLALAFAYEIFSREKMELASEFFQIAPEVRMTFKQFISRLIKFHEQAKEHGL